MAGVLLDPITGCVANEAQVESSQALLARAPAHVREELARAAEWGARERQGVIDGEFVRGPRNVRQVWESLLYCPTSDGATATAAAEALMVPDYTFPANAVTAGMAFKYTVWFRLSTAITTPGTTTLRLRWGGLAGVVLAASPAFAPDPTAAATSLACFVQYYLVCRTDGTAGTMFAMGQWSGTDFDDASATTVVGNLNSLTYGSAGSGVPAAVAVDTTTAKALSITYQPSVATASMTAHMAFLESLN